MSSSEDNDNSSEGSDDSDAESEEEEEQVDPLKLPPSSFSLPDGHQTYELWTIRMPVSVDHTVLNGVKLSLDNKVLGMVDSGDSKYGLVFGESSENESFRVLVEHDKKFMIPTNTPFAKHLNVVLADVIKEIPDTELAPGVDRAPTPIDPLRKAYSVVHQKQGLKRRWMPSGIPAALSKSDNKSQHIVQGLQDDHARQSTKGATSSFTEIKDASPIVSPPKKKKRHRDSARSNDDDRGGKEEMEGDSKPQSRENLKVKHEVGEDETEVINAASIELQKVHAIADKADLKRTSKQAKKESKNSKEVLRLKVKDEADELNDKAYSLSNANGTSRRVKAEFDPSVDHINNETKTLMPNLEKETTSDDDVKRSAKKAKKGTKKSRKEEKKAKKHKTERKV